MKKKPAAKPKPPDIPIREIRHQRVLLDSDLAAIYGVTTKRLNEQFRRNRQEDGRVRDDLFPHLDKGAVDEDAHGSRALAFEDVIHLERAVFGESEREMSDAAFGSGHIL